MKTHILIHVLVRVSVLVLLIIHVCLFAGQKSLTGLEDELLECILKIVHHLENMTYCFKMIAGMKEEAHYALLLQS